MDRHRALHVVGSTIVEGGLLVEAPEGVRVADQDALNGMLIGEGTTVVATFKIVPWRPGQEAQVYAHIELEFEIEAGSVGRPWGRLSTRLVALHRGVSEFVIGLAEYELGWTEADVSDMAGLKLNLATTRVRRPDAKLFLSGDGALSSTWRVRWPMWQRKNRVDIQLLNE